MTIVEINNCKIGYLIYELNSIKENVVEQVFTLIEKGQNEDLLL
jgi:hypothetical protein